MNNLYNFKNTIRHFIDVDHLIQPADLASFPTEGLCWTKPISFRIKKENDKYRTLKIPNILNFMHAYNYYQGLPHFNDINALDPQHKRMYVNQETGDFCSGKFDNQLNDDFMKLCQYDCLIKLDINEYYGKIYTHYLDLQDRFSLKDFVLSSLNNGKTGGLIMGNYLSLYFAEYMLSKISEDLQNDIDLNNLNCVFNYFSDDFYFFCNKKDIEKVITLFDKVLEQYDFDRKTNKQQLWDYEHYNSYNILTRYWKATIRHWNLDVLKDLETESKHGVPIRHRLSFLNQLIYRISALTDDKSKKTLITNFFKTKHFQETDFNNYTIHTYDYHQLCFLFKLAPESLLYTSYIFNNTRSFDKINIKEFLSARYKEALEKPLNDEQLYFYFAVKCFGFDDILIQRSQEVMKSENQILISYYLCDNFFNQTQKNSLKLLTAEQYWFQNYHLILYSPELKLNLDSSIDTYLIPAKAQSNPDKKNRYMTFYRENLNANNAIINDIPTVINNIKNYLSFRHTETAVDFDISD